MRFRLAAALLLAVPAAAALPPAVLERVGARPPAGTALPGGRFVAPDGHAISLTAIAGGRPLLLLFADYTCRHVCGPGLTLTAAALHDSGLAAGRDYRLAVIGLDPRDGAADARRMSDRLAPLPDVAAATTLLRGDPATIAATTRALGYGYAYDPQGDQFAHDASVYVFAADGRLAGLLPELALRPEALRAAVAGGRIGLAERVARLCYGLDHLAGRYDGAVAWLLRALALATVAALALLVLRLRRSAA